jgi:hypothetical protein
MRINISACVFTFAMTMLPLVALAQNNADPTKGARDPYRAGMGGAARDGCINIIGEAHNSADCSRIPANDKNTVLNSQSTDLSGRPTGASENAARNQRILLGMARN